MKQYSNDFKTFADKTISFPEPAILLSRNERLWDNPSHNRIWLAVGKEWNVTIEHMLNKMAAVS